MEFLLLAPGSRSRRYCLILFLQPFHLQPQSPNKENLYLQYCFQPRICRDPLNSVDIRQQSLTAWNDPFYFFHQCWSVLQIAFLDLPFASSIHFNIDILWQPWHTGCGQLGPAQTELYSTVVHCTVCRSALSVRLELLGWFLLSAPGKWQCISLAPLKSARAGRTVNYTTAVQLQYTALHCRTCMYYMEC